MDSKWIKRFMQMAYEVSGWSKDTTGIGAVCVSPDKRILSTGYNGFPSGIKDNERLQNREEKYDLVIHAELNSILNAGRNGVSLVGSTLFVFGLPPCCDCSKCIIQSGISEVYFVVDQCLASDKWTKSFEKSKAMFNESGVKFTELPSKNWISYK